MASATERWRFNAFTYANTGLVFYEFLITLDQEVSIMWRKSSQKPTWLFFINRYNTFLYALLGITPTSLLGCRPVLISLSLLVLVQFAVYSVFTSSRAYAMSGCNASLSCSVFVVSLVPLAINIYITATLHLTEEPYCASICLAPMWLQLRLTFTVRIAMLLLDALVLLLTWRSTWPIHVHARAAHMTSPLVTLLVRDGVFFFVGLLLIHVCRLITVFFGDDTWFDYFGPAWTGFLHSSLIPIMTSRFQLNLRQIMRQEQISTSVSRFSAMNFRIPSSINGNMSEPLEHGPSAEDVEDGNVEDLLNGRRIGSNGEH